MVVENNVHEIGLLVETWVVPTLYSVCIKILKCKLFLKTITAKFNLILIKVYLFLSIL